jgi:hypothetical protein
MSNSLLLYRYYRRLADSGQPKSASAKSLILLEEITQSLQRRLVIALVMNAVPTLGHPFPDVGNAIIY